MTTVAFGALIASEAVLGAGAFAIGRRPAVPATPPIASPASSAVETRGATSGVDADAALGDPSLDLGTLASSDTPVALAPDGPIQPTVQYEDALAHENDRIAFEPGGRVSVPFRPRPDDAWPVAGRRPVALPAGRATGREMAASAQGTAWAPGRQPIPVATPPADEGGSGPDSPVDAEPASAVVPSTATPADPAVAAGLRRQVFGFLPYWEVGSSTTVLNYSLLSTIAYFSVGADKSGNLKKKNADGTTTTGWGGWTSSNMTKVINAAHSAGTRVVLTLSVFAWTTDQAAVQKSILGSATNRLRLAQQAAAAVRDRGADGINLDFEPIASGYGDEFTTFVRTVRSELNKVRSGYQLTFDTTGFIGNYQVAAATASGGADAIFIMGYDFRTAGSSPVGSIAPLAGSAYDINDSVKAFLAQVPASKVILGVPYYGRAWSTTSSLLNAKNQSGTKYGSSVSVTYDNAMDLLAQEGRHYDPVEQVAWTAYKKSNCTATYGCVTTWRELYVDDAQALRAKYDLVNRYALRGVGMWALGYDGTRPELYDALNDKFLHDTTLPEAGVTMLPSSAPDEGIVVKWTGKDDAGIAAYDVQVSVDGGAWAAWRTGTTATSDVWIGHDGHRYAFRARARDTSGNWSSWNVSQTGAAPALARGSFGTVRVDGLSVRAAPDTSAATLGTASTNDVLAITGGPVSADGYTWYEVSGPIASWGTTGYVRVGAWVAAKSATDSFVVPRLAPNATTVDAGISGYGLAAGAADLGLAGTGNRVFSPNGDGRHDTLRLAWTNALAFDSLSLRVFRSTGSLAGTVALTSHQGAGAQTYAWNGRVGGGVLADGTYVLQLVGLKSGRSYAAPSGMPVTADQLVRFGVRIDSDADATFTPLGPVRFLDSRTGLRLSGALANRSPRTVQLGGAAGIPTDAVAATLNVTVVGATSAGYLAVTTAATSKPATSTLNVPRGDIRANGVTVPIGAGGKISLVWVGASGSHAHVIVDVTGWTR
ncbi:MAG TPA: glycosyl hydrolase family 18 protein [Candidatus Limnocylindrales bacterium]|nr:glycosyl hydrolase family 18 protein [Candidatus Limnocylindrales bacterium]